MLGKIGVGADRLRQRGDAAVGDVDFRPDAIDNDVDREDGGEKAQNGRVDRGMKREYRRHDEPLFLERRRLSRGRRTLRGSCRRSSVERQAGFSTSPLKLFWRSVQLGETGGEEATFGFEVDGLERLLIGRDRLVAAAKPPQQIAAHRGQHVIPIQLAAFADRIDQP